MDSFLQRWSQNPPAELATALTVMAILACDIVLPVPSSVISTLGGAQLGITAGTLTSWLGMNLGAVFGFAIARRWGRPLAERLSHERELKRIDALTDRYGFVILVVTRAIPVLAEASVLLVGIHGQAWRTFLPAVVLSNLGIAFVYSAFGELAQSREAIPVAVGISAALPLLLVAMTRRWGRKLR
jgi:uncharacterized membrane protein YdjX (TVP38/TMEM64 family)